MLDIFVQSDIGSQLDKTLAFVPEIFKSTNIAFSFLVIFTFLLLYSILLVLFSRFSLLKDTDGKVGKFGTVIAFSLSGLTTLSLFAFKPNISVFLEETFSGIKSYIIFILAIGCFLVIYESVRHATKKPHVGFGFAFLSTSFLLFTIWSSSNNVWLLVTGIISLIFGVIVLILKRTDISSGTFTTDRPFASSSSFEARRERIISNKSHLLQSMKRLDEALTELGREFERTAVPTAAINRLPDDDLRSAIHDVIQLTNDFLADLVTVERSNRELMTFVGSLPENPTPKQVQDYLEIDRAHASKYATSYRIANDQKEKKFQELNRAWKVVEAQYTKLSKKHNLSEFERNFMIPWSTNLKMVKAYIEDKDIAEIDEFLKKELK